MGYILPLAEQFNLDLSTKYLWTRQNSDDVTVAGDAVSFKASDSQRWRNGARLNGMFGADFAPYVGAAWEYEFDGDSKASINGRNSATPSLKGGTGIGELGVRFKPAASAFSADLGVQGYVGMREGRRHRRAATEIPALGAGYGPDCTLQGNIPFVIDKGDFAL